MVTITELLQPVVNVFETSELYDYILPFLLVLVLVYSILQRVNLFGPRGNKFNIIIAIVIGMLLARQGDLVEFINTYLPNVSAVIVVFFGFLILLGMFGIGSVKFKGGFLVLLVIIAVGGGIWALVQSTQQEEVSYTIFGNEIEIGEEDAGLLFLIGIAIILLAIVFKPTKKRGFEGFLDGMTKVGDAFSGQPINP